MRMDPDTKEMKPSINILNPSGRQRENHKQPSRPSVVTKPAQIRTEKVLGKRTRRSIVEDDEENDSFIASDDENNSEVDEYLNRVRSRKYHFNDSYSSDDNMEAGYDQILEEERRAEKIARQEDKE